MLSLPCAKARVSNDFKVSVKQSEQNTSEEFSWFSSEIFTNTTQNGKDNEIQSHNYETVGLLVKVFKILP